MRKIAPHQLFLILAICAIVGGAALFGTVYAGWLTAVEALLVAMVCATGAATGVVAIGVHRVLRRLRKLERSLNADESQLNRAAEQVDAALCDLRDSAGEDRLELLMRLDDLIKRVENVESRVDELRQQAIQP